jgi:DNA-binding transcriptional LysR family regulator
MNSFRHLEMIIALAEHGNFTRAAESLGISQPALTRGLHHIETALGVELFIRSNPVRPTPFGEVVLKRSGSLLQDFSEMMREVVLTRNIELGSITVSAAHYPAAMFVQSAVARFSVDHPQIQCSLLLRDWKDIEDDVRSSVCDFGIGEVREAEADPELQTEVLGEGRLILFARAGHVLGEKTGVELDDLLDFPWVGPRIPKVMAYFMSSGDRVFAYLDPKRKRMMPRIHVENYSAMRAIVLESNCISAAPPELIEQDISDGKLVAFPIERDWLKFRFGFITKRERQISPSAMRMMDVIRDMISAKQFSQPT